MYKRYKVLQPFNQSESLINLIRSATIKFFSSTPTKIKNYFINLVTLEGLSKYYSELNNNDNIIERPYLVTTFSDTPRAMDEISNVNLHTIRLMPALSMRMSKRYYFQDPHFATRMVQTPNTLLSRIDQYMTLNINHKIVCESYEMAYDIMRYSQSFFLQDKFVTFRNLVTLFMINIDDISQVPMNNLQEIKDNCLYVISDAKNRSILCLPSGAWLQVKVSDHTIETEGIPYEGTRITYSLSLNWQINYAEPAAYLLVF